MRIPLAHLLVRSPLPGIVPLMERVVECSHGVRPLVERLIEGDQDAVVAQAKAISQLERQADEAKNDVRAHMPIRLFLPVDRRDVLKLLSQVDAIADSAEDVGVLCTVRRMEVPDEFKTLLPLYVDRVLDTVDKAAELIAMLDTLLAAGFAGKPAHLAQLAIQETARREHESDKIQDQLTKILFQLEHQLPPVAIFMWMKVLNEIGDMANHAENVGDQFRLFIAH
jgi:uncharacterized protein